MTWNFCELFLFLINTLDTHDETGYHQHGLCENGERKFIFKIWEVLFSFQYSWNRSSPEPRRTHMLGTQDRRGPCAPWGCWPREASIAWPPCRPLQGPQRQPPAPADPPKSLNMTCSRDGRGGAVTQHGTGARTGAEVQKRSHVTLVLSSSPPDKR